MLLSNDVGFVVFPKKKNSKHGKYGLKTSGDIEDRGERDEE